ncbi:selenocysteine lyase isoform X2 [Triplophysa dalaica]|uniref:selenocysteine lyase isoform X2 n=1 Tax=Triplophysa dalaica TaxID=1582913 RepID=UPI0024DF7EEE|nr:selenocysteine lyase isoform X2 [Triplophysa dalaica]
MAEKADPFVILNHNVWGNSSNHPGSEQDCHHHVNLDNQTVADESERIYMDYNATTPVDPDVVRAVTEALTDAWGNPSSNYLPGLKARDAVYHSRDTVARMVGGKASDIIFTSGGTEANNLVFHTAVEHFGKCMNSSGGNANIQKLNRRGSLPHIITSNVEHDSIKITAEYLLKDGKADVTFVPISKVTARVEVEDVIAAIRPTTCLVSVMLANNETGIIMPIKDICQRVKEINKQRAVSTPTIFLHTDAAQAIGKIRVNAQDLGVDYITIVGHKFYGPRIGALFVNDPGTKTPVYPLLFGGGQERNFRPGTENTAMIAGLGKAVFGEDRLNFNSRFPGSDVLPNTCNVSILGRGLEGRRVLSTCRRLLASVGAACHSDRGDQASYILLNCGIPYDVATNALRISVGRSTSREDVEIVVEDLRETVEQLERMN